MSIDELRRLCTDETLNITQHMQKRMRQRGITYDDVVRAIRTGEIIEQYPSRYPYPGCLVLGMDVGNEHIHVVCGLGIGFLWVITAYRPDTNKWEADNRKRKEITL